MAGYKKQPRSDRNSIKYRLNPVEGASFELSDFVREQYAPAPSDDKQLNRISESKSQKILTTTELISTIGHIWDHANRLAVYQPKANLTDDQTGCKKEISRNLDKEENGWAPLSPDSKYFCVHVKSAGRFFPMVRPDLEFLKVTQKMSVFESWSFLRGGMNLANGICGGRGLTSLGIPYELGSIYRWRNETVPAGHPHADDSTQIENRTAGEHCIPGNTTGCARGVISGDTNSPACMQATEYANSCSDLNKSKDPSSCVNSNLVMDRGTTRSLLSDYFLKDVDDIKVDGRTLRAHCSSLYADYCINSLALCNDPCEKCHLTEDDVLLEKKSNQPERVVRENENRIEFPSHKLEKPHFALAKREHAFAGAMAGIFVSLCLHPVDTIKTVIQTCRAEQKSICYIGRSIVSERGLTGLYRGIASNIASSAPISAVYAFTYESVKGALLPHFPKEFHSLAHCIAGGCASVATSFIFTPSEHIKQQMQVGSHYHNCWNALIGIIKKGGLPSLYAGWGAVLCRNVPHSIIKVINLICLFGLRSHAVYLESKFYTYESLKQMMSPSLHFSAQPSTIQTLVCGGLAGSTAALFTTPFDVVKTRLQTQIPGSISQYNSVYHALQEIGKREGLKGLYRGLIPRLVMYMSQGAIFFGSYEFFKHLFSLDVPQLNAPRILHEHTKQDKAVSSVPTPSSASSAVLSPS
ncbi:hypothetical protein Patl1_17726 [Pistacia atlantica]|uniref:Uncharacterized protein n=1 Tax=Pistacia atlantica TaxID=434234 RepID=A0ACC1C1B3_9ROSI|nr:hypothetical protein Patl1_17726 [Pistacia atlantica]